MTHKSFTLIETMVAVSILAVAVIGPFSAVQGALRNSYVARDQLTAASLAQEGMEYIRSVRDGNFLNNRNWMHGLDPATGLGYACVGANPSQYCMVDPTRGDVHVDSPDNSAMQSYASVDAGNCGAGLPCLYIDPSTRLYNQQGVGDQTVFKRAVQVRILSANEVLVTVQVYWTTGQTQYSATVRDTLRDWL